MKSKIIIPIILILAAGILVYFLSIKENTNQTSGEMKLIPIVKGCAETDKGETSKTLGEEKEPEIKVEGNRIVYSRALSHTCCRKAEIEKKVNDFQITIEEVWSGEGCKCVCFSEIGAELENVPSGTFSVRVYEGDVKEAVKKLLIEKEVEIE